MANTRSFRHRDGRQEIVRVLSVGDLASWKKEDPLAYEKSIVWLENIEDLPFVRVYMVRCATSRRGRLSTQGGERVVGYSKLMADAPRDPQTKRFTRRLFYLTEEDRSGGVPEDGRIVDPKTVMPGAAGQPPAIPRPLPAVQLGKQVPRPTPSWG